MSGDDEALESWRVIGRGRPSSWREQTAVALAQLDGADPLRLLPGDEHVLLAGDWHSNTQWGRSVIARAGAEGIRLVVQLGDFGIGNGGVDRAESYLDELHDACVEHDVILAFLDGNHEQFHTLRRFPVHECGLRPVRPTVWHVPRGTSWVWHGVRWAAVGGAASPDRASRNEDVDWFPEEVVGVEEAQRISAELADAVDVLLLHDAPREAPVASEGWPAGWAAADLLHTQEHRRRLSDVCRALRPRRVVHGHWHHRYDESLLTGWGECRFTGLGADGDPGNVVAVTLDAGPRPPAGGR